MLPLITSTVRFAHQVLTDALEPGDIAIDATAGNGHDTLFLARLVGDAGQVHAIDIQPAALESTKARLQKECLLQRVHLHLARHEDMTSVLPPEQHGHIKAVMFNLGFLPGSPKNLTTSAESTLAALQAALPLLTHAGVITIVCYTGHPGGMEEEAAVRNWCESLSIDTHRVLHYELLNKRATPVRLYCVQAKSGYGDSLL